MTGAATTTTERWGTWEELLLGGAVLRYGTAAWDVVADELRARTTFPSLFTPQECEAHYEDSRGRYSSFGDWYEELRRKRIADLKRGMAKSEDIIRSLEFKIEVLNSARGSDNSHAYNTRSTETSLPADGSSSKKEASRDGSYSAVTTRVQECWIPDSVSSRGDGLKVDLPKNLGSETSERTVFDIQSRIHRQRMRISHRIAVKVQESNMVGVEKEDQPLGCKHDLRAPNEDYVGHTRRKDIDMDLAGIVDSIMKHKRVSLFRRQLEKQRNMEHKKIIGRYVNWQSLISRINNGSISSAMELFRELLQIADDIIVFYGKNSSVYKSAVALRHLVTKAQRDHSLSSNSGDNGGVKIQIPHACTRNGPASAEIGVEIVGDSTVENDKRGGRSEVLDKYQARKRGVGSTVKCGGRGSGKNHSKEGRKRARRN